MFGHVFGYRAVPSSRGALTWRMAAGLQGSIEAPNGDGIVRHLISASPPAPRSLTLCVRVCAVVLCGVCVLSFACVCVHESVILSSSFVPPPHDPLRRPCRT